MKRILPSATVAIFLIAGTAAAAPAEKLPSPNTFLFWTPAQQAVGYRNIKKIFPTRIAARGPAVSVLPHDTKPFDVSYTFGGQILDTAGYMKATDVSGLIVIQHGHVLLERYGLGRTEKDRWTSFSVAKSVTSTLIGAAIKDGYIKSLDSQLVDYLPELKGTAYDGVTIADLITMRSGVKWNEDYTDPKSDIGQFSKGLRRADGMDPIEAYMAKLPRAHQPGTVFHYDTGETDLAGILVARATGKHLADYLSEKIWSKIGTEQDAVWIVDQGGNELGGCCLSMTLRDYARFGLFFLHGGVVDGKQILPAGWAKAASTSYVKTGDGDTGYGYFWWIHPDGTYEAEGIFGQSIFLDPRNDIVIVTNSAWPVADDDKYWVAQDAYFAAVEKALAK
ncbi:MAG TPA: serine hydrolase [Rhizomicrobium sp.]|nr:serine hydrolase [Rhizomicrobium sp.]